MDAESIEREARKEIDQEKRRRLIDEAKVRLLTQRPWWHQVFPFKITITRR